LCGVLTVSAGPGPAELGALRRSLRFSNPFFFRLVAFLFFLPLGAGFLFPSGFGPLPAWFGVWCPHPYGEELAG